MRRSATIRSAVSIVRSAAARLVSKSVLTSSVSLIRMSA